MTWHVEALSPAQLTVLPSLGPLMTSRGFYLAGGTATALYLGHRRSIDFDWFCRSAFSDPEALSAQLRQTGLSLQDPRISLGTLHAVVGGVRVSFFSYPYDEVGKPIVWQDYCVELASLDDIACMKLAAIAQRGSRKDFVDLYAIARHRKPIKDIFELYRRKYSASDIAHLLVALTYFDDAEEEPTLDILSDIRWDEVKRGFQQWARTLAG